MDRAAGISYLYELSAAAGGGVVTASANGGPTGLSQGPSPGLSVNSQMATDHLIASNSDNYCLRWNEFEKKYAESFRVLRDNEYFTDVTLTTEGHSVKAHRVILSACSTYFHAILKSMGPWQHPVLMLQDVKPQELNALIDFIYFGQVHMSQDSLQPFLKIAERLKIKGLCETLSPISMPPTPTGQIQGQVGSVGVGARGTMGQVNQGMALPPMSNSPHSLVTTSVASNMTAANFENLLPRSPYIPPDVNTSSCNNVQGVPGVSTVTLPAPIRAIPTSAPPAHQSPKQVRSASNPRPESLVYVSPAKRTKYSNMATTGPLSPQSILRNQLQLAKEIGGHPDQSHVEVKSEPMAILSSQEDVPSSGVNVQELMPSHEGDLASLSAALPQGISPHFMFSPDPEAGGGAAGQTLVAVEDHRSGGHGTTTVRMVDAATLATTGVVTSGVVTSVNVSNHTGILVPTSHHLHAHLPTHSQQAQQGQQPQPQTHHQQHYQTQHQQQGGGGHAHQQLTQQHNPASHQGPTHHLVQQTELPKEEPQDLTPSQHDSPNTSVGTPGSNAGMHTPNNHGGGHLSNNSPSTPTPPKNSNGPTAPGSAGGGSDKKSAARKSCPYCNKDFHEMSLKRHIKDVHFRSQNTYVICPQCCKQYASQNSLYSHLNRVHNVKKEVMSDIQLGPPGSGGGGASTSGATGNGQAGGGHGNDSNHHDGIVNLTHHSDSSNG